MNLIKLEVVSDNSESLSSSWWISIKTSLWSWQQSDTILVPSSLLLSTSLLSLLIWFEVEIGSYVVLGMLWYASRSPVLQAFVNWRISFSRFLSNRTCWTGVNQRVILPSSGGRGSWPHSLHTWCVMDCHISMRSSPCPLQFEADHHKWFVMALIH